MSAGTLISFETLLAPAPSNGDTTVLDENQLDELKRKRIANRDKLKRDRVERDAEEESNIPAIKANWESIAAEAEKLLHEPYKDLQVAAHLTEALVKRHGFIGLRDGLTLMRRLVDECWDRLNPPPVDGDLDVHATPFNWLDQGDGGARFPNTIRAIPLIRTYCYLDWKPDHNGRFPPNREAFDKAAHAATLEDCQKSAASIQDCLDESKLLAEKLNERMGTEAPGLMGLRQALEECYNLVQDIMRKKQPLAESGAAGVGADGSMDLSGAGPASRDVIYQQLKRAADSLKRIEPHSPVPYLVNRAVELGALPFHEMIRALIRDATVLEELTRELGIKEEAGQRSEESE
jgi:type VI secretion system protein ImpA